MSNAIQRYNPANDYEFSAYELYFYSKSEHSLIIKYLSRLELVKKQLGEAINPLEAAVLVALLAIKENHPTILSLLPNYLADIVCDLPYEQVIKNISYYYRQDESVDYDYYENAQAGNLSPFLEVPAGSEDLKEFMHLRPLILTSEEPESSFNYQELADNTSLVLISDHFTDVNSYNLLEVWSKARLLLAEGAGALRINKNLSKTGLNPLTLYYEQLLRRGIITAEQLSNLQATAIEEFKSLTRIKDVDLGFSENSLSLWLAYLSGEKLSAQLDPKDFQALHKFSSFPEDLFFDLNLDLEINIEQLSSEVFNYLLNRFYRYGKIVIEYQDRERVSEQLVLRINYSGFKFPEELVSFYQQIEGGYFLEGEDLTIIAWGRAADSLNNWMIKNEEIAPEVFILKDLVELPEQEISLSLQKTSKLLLLPDSAMNFPLTDILARKLSNQIFNLLDLPVQTLSIDKISDIQQVMEL